MPTITDSVFDLSVWEPALRKYGAVVRLSVALYDAEGVCVCGPTPPTPITSMLEKRAYEPEMFADCARTCLAQSGHDCAPVVVSDPSGLSAIGVSVLLDGRVVGAAVAGYALINFCDSVALARFARQSGTEFQELWAVARNQPPLPLRRLTQVGELLKVLVDTLMRENGLRRDSERTALQFSHLANHDALTDLPNRVLLGDRLSRALASAHRHHRRMAVLYLDIDRFKEINDSLGHDLGDELLRAVAREVSLCVRHADTVSRHGGDEFVIVLSELVNAEDAAAIATKIISALCHPRHIAGHDLRVTVSVGISVFPDDGEDAETLLKRADLALYYAKEQGRGCFKFFQPKLNEIAVERQTIETSLHDAVKRREFALLYQPKIQLNNGDLAGAEALIRWNHPSRGLLEPAQFIPIAEHSGLILPIGRWVVHEACRQAQAWQDAGLRSVPISVNVSALEFKCESFVPQIVGILQDTGLDPQLLEIELTESVLMADITGTKSSLAALKALGVQVAIDDFGIGWSSLSYLRDFQIDALKIDKSFVEQIAAGAAPIISAVIQMGNSLNHRVIAEGVETREQLAFLQAEECAQGQGFYFSAPLTAPQFARVLQNGTVMH
ncbi:MAG: EAL domain-containing protein [Acidobacteriota bacterium]